MTNNHYSSPIILQLQFPSSLWYYGNAVLSLGVITSPFTFAPSCLARAKGEQSEELKVEMKHTFGTERLLN